MNYDHDDPNGVMGLDQLEHDAFPHHNEDQSDRLMDLEDLDDDDDG